MIPHLPYLVRNVRFHIQLSYDDALVLFEDHPTVPTNQEPKRTV